MLVKSIIGEASVRDFGEYKKRKEARKLRDRQVAVMKDKAALKLQGAMQSVWDDIAPIYDYDDEKIIAEIKDIVNNYLG